MQSNDLEKTLAELCAGNLIACEKLSWMLDNRAFPEILQIKNFPDQIKYGTKQYEKASAYLRKESQAGNLFASAFLGFMHVNGQGVKKNKSNSEKGLELIQKSVKGDNPLGYYFQGRCYRDGVQELKSFKSDFPKAIEAFEKGAAKNCTPCLVGLAQMHEEGQGFERSLAEATKIYEKAARLGSPVAIHKYTQRGTARKANPFMLFTPRNLDFVYEWVKEDRAYVSGGYHTAMNTTYHTETITVKITYIGQIDIGQAFELVKKIGPEICQWEAMVKANKFVIPAEYYAAKIYDDGDKLISYIFSRELANIICDAESLIKERVEKAQLRQVSAPSPTTAQAGAGQDFPGIFFATQNPQQSPPAFSQPQPVDPSLMGQIVQTLYQNPMFAAEVAELYRRYHQNIGAQPNSNNYTPATPSYGGLK